MADTKHKFTSFAAPTQEDVTAWNTLSDQERRDAFNTFVDRALARPPVRMTRNELMADARAALRNG